MGNAHLSLLLLTPRTGEGSFQCYKSLGLRYGGFVEQFPLGALFSQGLTVKTGQTHVHKYLKPLRDRIQNGEIDPTFVITHDMSLEESPQGDEIFKHKRDNCIKIVLNP